MKNLGRTLTTGFSVLALSSSLFAADASNPKKEKGKEDEKRVVAVEKKTTETVVVSAAESGKEAKGKEADQAKAAKKQTPADHLVQLQEGVESQLDKLGKDFQAATTLTEKQKAEIAKVEKQLADFKKRAEAAEKTVKEMEPIKNKLVHTEKELTKTKASLVALQKEKNDDADAYHRARAQYRTQLAQLHAAIVHLAELDREIIGDEGTDLSGTGAAAVEAQVASK